MTLVVILCFCVIICTNGSNILGIHYNAIKSHHIVGEMLLKELARRGHNVTMASPFPLAEKFENYTDIHLAGILEYHQAHEKIFSKSTSFDIEMLDIVTTQSELTLNHTEMAKLLKSGTKFDVIIIDAFVNPSSLVFGKLFDAPVIAIAPIGIHEEHFGFNPVPPSYVPRTPLPFRDNMTFFQRVANGIASVAGDIMNYKIFQYHQVLVERHFKNLPPLEEILRDYLALVLSNSHYSFEPPRPFVPNVIPVGGFHVQKPKQLQGDIKKFMDLAQNGVIYFSLGSNAKSAFLPEEQQQQIMRAFSKIPYKVLWKLERDDLLDIPDNILISKWFPQNDILAHPNLKLFISHGGLMSTIEALYHGVPVLGTPIFYDQIVNIPRAVAAGYALQLDLADLNEHSLSAALTEMLNNPKYLENAKKRSLLLHDQPMPPMETAVFWVEHVIRHKGAPHLRNAGMSLRWYQYLMLDVVALILVMILLVLYVVSNIVGLVRKKKLKND